MFVTDDMIAEMERRFGIPVARKFRIPSTGSELARIASSQKSGRNHDVTLYVQKDDQWVVIAKHAYPPGLFRSPSGGLHPGENFITGLNREVAEELGCRVRIDRFLLKTDVEFYLDPPLPLADQKPEKMSILYGPPMAVDRKSLKRRISVYRVPEDPLDEPDRQNPVSGNPDASALSPSESATSIRWRSWVFLASYLEGDFDYTDHGEIREVRLVDWEQFTKYGKIMRTTGSGGLHYRAQLHEAVAEILGKL